ncbi:hypothetical protein Tco_0158463, partial [Tanacetum coccineum]
LDEHVPVYVLEPEHSKYHAPSDDDIQVEDQPYVDDASLTVESPRYIADSDSIEEDTDADSIDYPDEPKDGEEDDDEDSKKDPSEEREPMDDEDDDDTYENDEEPTKDEEEEEHLALVDSSIVPVVDPVPSAGDRKAFGTNESAPIPRSPQTRGILSLRDDIPEEDMPPRRRFVLTAPSPGCDVAESYAVAATRAPRAANRAEDVGYVRALQTSEHRMMTSIEEVNLRVSYQRIRLEIDVGGGSRDTAYKTKLHEVRQAYLSSEARNKALLARLETLENHITFRTNTAPTSSFNRQFLTGGPVDGSCSECYNIDLLGTTLSLSGVCLAMDTVDWLMWSLGEFVLYRFIRDLSMSLNTCLFSKRTLRGRSLCFVLEMLNKVNGIQISFLFPSMPRLGFRFVTVGIKSQGYRETRFHQRIEWGPMLDDIVILFATLLYHHPLTILPTSLNYSPISDSCSDPLRIHNHDHIPSLPVPHLFLSLDDDTTESDLAQNTPPSPYRVPPFTEITASTQRSPIIPRRRVMILSPGQPIPHGRPYRYHLNGPGTHDGLARKRVGHYPLIVLSENSTIIFFRLSSERLHQISHSVASSDPSSRHSLSDHSSLDLSSTSVGPSRKRCRSPMTSVPVLSPVSGALSPVRADLIPSPKRIKDSGYLADVEVDPRETSLRDDAIVRDRGIDARVIVEAIDRDETEMDVRGPVEVRVERVTHPVMSEDIPEPTQEGAVEATYKTLGDLREQGHRMVRVESAVIALTKRIAKLERDNRRLRETISVESQRVDRLQRGMSRM